MSKKRKIAIYAGSFDPPTIGHMDIVKRAAALFADLQVLVADNNAKSYLMPLEERISLMEELCIKLKNVTVSATSMLVTGYMIENGINILVRSVRNIHDFEAEATMAQWNKSLYAKAETVFIMAKPELAHISSTGVKEIISFAGDFSPFVPPLVHDVLTKKIKGVKLTEVTSTSGLKIKEEDVELRSLIKKAEKARKNKTSLQSDGEKAEIFP
jgi:pantetheine-phosphate adenylyltransferase